MRAFAQFMHKELGLPGDEEDLADICAGTDRYAMYRAGPVLSISVSTVPCCTASSPRHSGHVSITVPRGSPCPGPAAAGWSLRGWCRGLDSPGAGTVASMTWHNLSLPQHPHTELFPHFSFKLVPPAQASAIVKLLLLERCSRYPTCSV